VNLKTLGVGVLITVTVVLAEALVNFDPASITDWRSWAVGLGAGVVRQVASYVLARVAERQVVERRAGIE
jgi:hypothetical protein